MQASVPTAGPNVEQHFGNAEATDGGFLFQGIVNGNVHINRELSSRPFGIICVQIAKLAPLSLPTYSH